MSKTESVIYIAAGIMLAFLMSGCSYSRDQIGFFDQCIKADGWGLNLVSPYGVVNAGKLTYERNVNCGKDINQTQPISPLMP